MNLQIAAGPVTVCQLQVELDMALELYRELKPKRVLELGTASGGTLWHWITNAPPPRPGPQKRPQTIIVTIDLPEPDYPPPSEELITSWCKGTDVWVVAVQGNTHQADTRERAAESAPYDMLFIDACHAYDDVKQDWDDYSPLVRSGGLIMLHDIALVRSYGNGTTAGVGRLFRELQQQGHWTRELRAAPDLGVYGIGVIRVP